MFITVHKNINKPSSCDWLTIFTEDEKLQLIATGNPYLTTPAWEPHPKIFPLSGALTNLMTATFSPQGERLLLGNRFGTIQLWDVPARRLLTTWQVGASVYELKFSPDGQTVGVAGGDGFVRLYALPTGKLLHAWKGHVREVGTIVFSPDGQRIYSSGFDGLINGWEIAKEQPIFQQQLLLSQGGAIALDYAPNGKFLAVGYEQAAILWDRVSQQPRFILRGQTDAIWGVRFSPDSKLLATASWDGTVNLWDTETGQERAHLTGHSASVTAVAFAPDGKLLATGSHDHTIKLWDTRTGNLVRTLTGPGDQVLTVAFSPDGRRLAAAGADTRVYVFEVSSGQELLTLRGHTDEVWSLAFAPDGRTLYSGSWDKTVRIWRTASGMTTTPTPRTLTLTN